MSGDVGAAFSLAGIMLVLLLCGTIAYEALDVIGVVGGPSCADIQKQEGPYANCYGAP
jgi:hypothetical protein